MLLARVRSWGQPPMGPPGSGSETPGLVRGTHAGGVTLFLKACPRTASGAFASSQRLPQVCL